MLWMFTENDGYLPFYKGNEQVEISKEGKNQLVEDANGSFCIQRKVVLLSPIRNCC